MGAGELDILYMFFHIMLKLKVDLRIFFQEAIKKVKAF